MTSEQIRRMPYCPYALGGRVKEFKCVGGKCMAWDDSGKCKALEGEPSAEAKEMIKRARDMGR